MTYVLLVLLAFLAGYLARRWHRPVGHHAQADPAAVIVSLAGGAPYTTLSVRSRVPLDGQALRDVVRELRQRSGVGTP